MPGQVWNIRAPGQGDSVAVIAQNSVTNVASWLEGVAHVDRHARQHGVNDGHLANADEQQPAGTHVGPVVERSVEEWSPKDLIILLTCTHKGCFWSYVTSDPVMRFCVDLVQLRWEIVLCGRYVILSMFFV